MKLAQAALLRTLMSKHGSPIPELLRLVVKQAILITGAHTARCALGSQTQAIAIAIFETVHFLFNDIGDFPHGAGEKLCLLKNRKADFSITVARQQPSDD
jgi:hypothetical protein